ncbi:hypothetical protein GF357_02625 [Candidatus Dojkabacteria bacterium]|nr:hypothetical protein [Candidatus Dojkabacteria bacterium]
MQEGLTMNTGPAHQQPDEPIDRPPMESNPGASLPQSPHPMTAEEFSGGKPTKRVQPKQAGATQIHPDSLTQEQMEVMQDLTNPQSEQEPPLGEARQFEPLSPQPDQEAPAESEKTETLQVQQTQAAAAFAQGNDNPDLETPENQYFAWRIKAAQTLEGGIHAVKSVFNKANSLIDAVEAAADNFVASHNNLSLAREKYRAFQKTGAGKVISMGAGFAISGALGPAATLLHAYKAMRSTREFMMKNELSLRDLFSTKEGRLGLLTGAGTTIFTRYILKGIIPGGPAVQTLVSLASSVGLDTAQSLYKNVKLMSPAKRELAAAWQQANEQSNEAKMSLEKENLITSTSTGNHTYEKVNFDKLLTKSPEELQAIAKKVLVILKPNLDALEFNELVRASQKNPADLIHLLNQKGNKNHALIQAMVLNHIESTGFDSERISDAYINLDTAATNLIKTNAGNMFAKSMVTFVPAAAIALKLATTPATPAAAAPGESASQSPPEATQQIPAGENFSAPEQNATIPDSLKTEITDSLDPDGAFDAKLFEDTAGKKWLKLDVNPGDSDGPDFWVEVDTSGTEPGIKTDTVIAISQQGAARLLGLEMGLGIKEVENLEIQPANSDASGFQFQAAVVDPDNPDQFLGILVEQKDGTVESSTAEQVMSQINAGKYFAGKSIADTNDGTNRMIVDVTLQNPSLGKNGSGQIVLNAELNALNTAGSETTASVQVTLKNGDTSFLIYGTVVMKPEWDTTPPDGGRGFYGITTDTLEEQVGILMESLTEQEDKDRLNAQFSALMGSDIDEDGIVEFLFDSSGDNGPHAKAQATILSELLRRGYGNPDDEYGELKLLLTLRKIMADAMRGEIEIGGATIGVEDITADNIGEIVASTSGDLEKIGLKAERVLTLSATTIKNDRGAIVAPTFSPKALPAAPTALIWGDLIPPTPVPKTPTPAATGTPTTPPATATVEPPTLTPTAETKGDGSAEFADQVLKDLFGRNPQPSAEELNELNLLGIQDTDGNGSVGLDEVNAQLMEAWRSLKQAYPDAGLNPNRPKAAFEALGLQNGDVDIDMNGKEGEAPDLAALLLAAKAEGIELTGGDLQGDINTKLGAKSLPTNLPPEQAVQIFSNGSTLSRAGTVQDPWTKAITDSLEFAKITESALVEWGIPVNNDGQIGANELWPLADSLNTLGWEFDGEVIKEELEPWENVINRFISEDRFRENWKNWVNSLEQDDQNLLKTQGVIDSNGDLLLSGSDITLQELAALKKAMEEAGLTFSPKIFKNKIAWQKAFERVFRTTSPTKAVRNLLLFLGVGAMSAGGYFIWKNKRKADYSSMGAIASTPSETDEPTTPDTSQGPVQPDASM